jgi:hypothetical protein
VSDNSSGAASSAAGHDDTACGDNSESVAPATLIEDEIVFNDHSLLAIDEAVEAELLRTYTFCMCHLSGGEPISHEIRDWDKLLCCRDLTCASVLQAGPRLIHKPRLGKHLPPICTLMQGPSYRIVLTG